MSRPIAAHRRGTLLALPIAALVALALGLPATGQASSGKCANAGKSADEITASKPLADLDPVWGHGMLNSDFFVQMICSAL